MGENVEDEPSRWVGRMLLVGLIGCAYLLLYRAMLTSTLTLWFSPITGSNELRPVYRIDHAAVVLLLEPTNKIHTRMMYGSWYRALGREPGNIPGGLTTTPDWPRSPTD